MRRAARVDENQMRLVKVARQLGLLVVIIKQPVDLLVYRPKLDKWVPTEVKNPTIPHSYTRQQKDFIEICKLYNAPFITWLTVDDVIRTANE